MIFILYKDAYPEDYQTTKNHFIFKIFFILLQYLIKQKIINLKYFLSSFFFYLFLDIIFQLIVGKDIFNIPELPSKLSDLYDELIAGVIYYDFQSSLFFYCHYL